MNFQQLCLWLLLFLSGLSSWPSGTPMILRLFLLNSSRSALVSCYFEAFFPSSAVVLRVLASYLGAHWFHIQELLFCWWGFPMCFLFCLLSHSVLSILLIVSLFCFHFLLCFTGRPSHCFFETIKSLVKGLIFFNIFHISFLKSFSESLYTWPFWLGLQGYYLCSLIVVVFCLDFPLWLFSLDMNFECCTMTDN